MARRTALDAVIGRFTFGGRVPGGVGLLLAVTLVSSLGAAFASRHLSSLFQLGSLQPDRVFRFEGWRLVTWAVLEPSPLYLVFACLLLYWFGRDLAEDWGSRRFLAIYVGTALVAAIGTCLVALVDTAVRERAYVGSWPLTEAMTVAWGLWFPQRVVRIYFIIPIRGYVLAWLTVAITVIYAIYAGWESCMPSLLAEGAILAWLFRAPVVSRWKDWRQRSELAARTRRRARRGEQRMASVHVLKRLEENDDDLPPLSPELEGKLGRLVEDAAKAVRDERGKRGDGG